MAQRASRDPSEQGDAIDHQFYPHTPLPPPHRAGFRVMLGGVLASGFALSLGTYLQQTKLPIADPTHASKTPEKDLSIHTPEELKIILDGLRMRINDVIDNKNLLNDFMRLEKLDTLSKELTSISRDCQAILTPSLAAQIQDLQNNIDLAQFTLRLRIPAQPQGRDLSQNLA